MIRVVTILALVGATASADDTWQAKAHGAVRIHRLENVVWTLTAACDKGDDTQQRQCRHVRDARAAELAAQALIVDADADAFDVGAWSSAKKSSAVTLSACIRCAGVELDGKTWYVVGSATPPAFANGKPKVALLADTTRQFPDEDSAKVWGKTVATARVQLLVKLPARPASARWTAEGKTGLALDILGYRVFTPCDGAIVAASPQSAPADPDKSQCTSVAAEAKPAVDAPKLDSLTATAIQDAMKPVVEAANACFESYGVAGKAKLKLTVLGDGTIAKYEQQGDFADTPTGKCIDAAIPKIAFPRVKKPKQSFSYPIILQ